MKDIGIVRNIDEMGRIVIPMELRRKMDIDKGDEIEFFIDGDRIVLRKYQPSCFFCGSESVLVEYKGKCLCTSCIAEMKAKF